jgi:hypothetical protein
MVLYIKMDQHVWAEDDFTNGATYDLSGSVYRDSTFTTLESDLETFTGSFRLIDDQGSVHYENNTSDLTLNTDGTFTVTFGESRAPTTYGAFRVRLKLEKSGSRLTAIGVNGSDKIFIEHN